MDGTLPQWRGDKRTASPDSRRQIERCLRHAFALGNSGSFTSLLHAIGDDTGKARG